jgi:hypothetical protein
MIKIEKKTFENQPINFDGVQYVNCNFNRCQLMFTGMVMPQMINCQVSPDSGWLFTGPAQNMLSFLSGLDKAGPAGTALVETIFQLIRNGSPSQPQIAVQPGPVVPPGVVN